MQISKNRHVSQMLGLLMNSKDVITVPEFQKHLAISRRTVYYSIAKINTFLNQEGIDTVSSIKNLGFYLSEQSRKELQNIENKNRENTNEDLFNFSKEQRIKTIIWSLINNDKISLTTIETTFNVSRNTADNDFKHVNLLMAQCGLKLITSHEGHKIIGPEIKKRNWVYEHFLNEDPILFSLLTSSVNPSPDINIFLKEFEKMTGNFFTDDAFVYLSAYLSWYLNRIKDSTNRLANTHTIPSNLLALEWAQKFLFKHCIVNLGEAGYLIDLVHSSQFVKANSEYGGIQEILPIAKKIIFRFNRATGVELKLDSLQVNLATHLLAAYYRIKFGISYKNSNLNTIKNKYSELFSFTKFAVKPFEQFVKKTIPDDEIALIALYFGGELKAIEDQNLNQDQVSVMIVCSSGIGTSRILKQQLTEKFPGISFSEPFNTFTYENSSLKGIKLIISTIDIPRKGQTNMVKVAAIPNEQDWKNIENALQKAGLIEFNERLNVEGLLDIISEYARIEDPINLKKSLKKYLELQGTTNVSKKNNMSLDEIFTKQNITFADHVDNFKQALSLAFDPLVKNHSIEKTYIDKIIQLTQLHGPYMLIENDVLLAHAKAIDGVNKTGFSFLLLKKPVVLFEKNQRFLEKKIRIIIGFSTIDTTSHLKTLGEVMKLLQNKDLMGEIRSSNSKYDLLKNHS
ncbi:BglG family transcription antiterminator [Oenococcus sp.]|uniref:BglG family transcription antiterminator n=1 Tax=Oenococcus sp. TaxID=1979414 RepID=UPI0039E9D311